MKMITKIMLVSAMPSMTMWLLHSCNKTETTEVKTLKIFPQEPIQNEEDYLKSMQQFKKDFEGVN